MKRLINLLVVIVSMTLGSIANAALIEFDPTNDSLASTYQNGTKYSQSFLDGTLDYTLYQNFMIMEFDVSNLNLAHLELTPDNNDYTKGYFQVSDTLNIYTEQGVNVFSSVSDNWYEMIMFNTNDIKKFAFEISDDLEFYSIDFGAETKSGGFTLTNGFNDYSEVSWNVINVRKAGTVDVPEPSSFAIFALGVIALIRKRINRK